jgi:hypothetical protein
MSYYVSTVAKLKSLDSRQESTCKIWGFNSGVVEDSSRTCRRLGEWFPTFHTLPPNFAMINFNIILPSMPRSYKRSFPFTFYNQNSYTFQSDDPSNVSWGVQIMKLLIMHFSPASCHFLALRFKYPPQHCVFKHFKPTETKLYHHGILNLVSYLFTI